ncbi:hypothetical protein NDU88_000920 [Pleurodeles waltl]|uniref:Reverse transcriptase zinc-binding domain-containing protein n=1 Tax=Pleurodeles waltl TaxID=8319 RepID=A0AAV7MIY9_PLEWA|nr:hypothetical protein NDU88_000920 [Pleurodeles waltl]
MSSGRRLITWFTRALSYMSRDLLHWIRRTLEQDVGREFLDKEWDRVLIYQDCPADMIHMFWSCSESGRFGTR